MSLSPVFLQFSRTFGTEVGLSGSSSGRAGTIAQQIESFLRHKKPGEVGALWQGLMHACMVSEQPHAYGWRSAGASPSSLITQHVQVDSDEVLKIKTLIRYTEARSGAWGTNGACSSSAL